MILLLIIAHHPEKKGGILVTRPLLLSQETSAICSRSNRILSGILGLLNLLAKNQQKDNIKSIEFDF
jgi:hypothetical protein